MGISSVYAQVPLSSMVNVGLNTWVMNPLLMTVVGHWLAQPRGAYADVQPWRFLDQGFGKGSLSLWLRFLTILVYVGPQVYVWWKSQE